MYCPKCGEPNIDGAKFCSSCGEALPERRAQSASVSTVNETEQATEEAANTTDQAASEISDKANEAAEKASQAAGEVADKAGQVASEVADKATQVASEVADKAGVVFNDVKAKAEAGTKDITAAVNEYKSTGYFKYEMQLYYILDILLVICATIPMLSISVSVGSLLGNYLGGAAISGSIGIFTLSGLMNFCNDMLNSAVAVLSQYYGESVSLAEMGVASFSPWDFVLWIIGLAPIFGAIYNILQHKGGKQSIIGGAVMAVVLVIVIIAAGSVASQIQSLVYQYSYSTSANINLTVSPSWGFWFAAIVAAASIAVNVMKFKKPEDVA